MKSVQYGLIVLLFLCPLLFGTVEPWSLAITETMCVFLVSAWFFGQMREGRTHIAIVKPPMLVPLGIILGLALFQVIPLPPSLVSVISPRTYSIYRDASLTPDNLPWLSLSLYPRATVLEIVRLMAYLCVYFLALQTLRDQRSMERMTTAVLMVGVVVSLSGIFQTVSWNRKVLWLREVNNGLPFGPYFNKNHFAGLMEMIIPVAVGLTIYLLPSVRTGRGAKTLLSDFLTDVHSNKLILTMASVIIMITALFISLSRGGIVGLSLSMIFFGVMLLLRNSTRRRGWTIVCIFLIILFSVGWFGWRPIIDKFEGIKKREGSTVARLNNWKDSIGMIGDFPLFGTGLGTYEYVYPRYRTVPGPEKWEHAHNDYVEGAVELGIGGLAAGIYALGTFYLMMFRVLRQRKSLGSRLLAIGGIAGIAAIVIHSLMDFNLHIGANGLFFSFLFGYSIAAAHIKMTDDGRGTILQVKEIAVPGGNTRRLLVASVMVVCVVVAAVPLLDACADIVFSIGNGETNEGNEMLIAKERVFRKAQALSPLDARYPFALGNISLALGRRADAVADYARAAALEPVSGEYLQMLGIALGRDARADRLMRASIENDPRSPWRHKNYALWLLSNGRKEEGMREMKMAISIDPLNTRLYVTGAVLSGLSRDEVKAVIPPDPSAQMLYGQYREELGDVHGAVQAYLAALTVMKPGAAGADVYLRIAALYDRKGQAEEALRYYREGVTSFPSVAGLRYGLARVCEKLNLREEALEQYGFILSLNPSDTYAQRKLKELSGGEKGGPGRG